GTTDIASDKHGHVVYVGHGCDSIDEPQLTECRWFVRFSRDGGLKWANVDEVSSPELPFWEPQKVRIDSRGRVIVVGFYSSSKPSEKIWAVTRVFDPLGRKWVNVDMMGPEGPESANWDVVVLPTGEMITSGYTRVDGRLNWLVRKSDGFGKNWKTVEGHLCPNEKGVSRAFPISLFNQAIFVGGYTKCEGQARHHVVVRRSLDHGATWKTLLDQESPGGIASLSDMVALGFKDVILTGRRGDSPAGAVLRAELGSAP
ncbi:MAG: glycoside hydrolase, partial [Bdellovibrionales bacterium]|nr:glycoside hydrolase [Bdellovibrionales bacterium]